MIKYLTLLAAVLCLAGCDTHTVSGPTEHESHSAKKDAAKSLQTELRMGAGSLKITGGASDWMQGDFAFNVPAWKPNIRYVTSGDRGELTIEQADTHSSMNSTNTWDLRLNNDAPTDLIVRMGAGEAQLEVGAMTLHSLVVEMGAGELRLDLRGSPKNDYDVKVRGGAGEATVYVPQNVGVYAKATGGLGSVNAQGLRSDDGHWVNDAYDHAKVQIHLDIEGGVGSINLIAK
jgi:hypothetical protein